MKRKSGGGLKNINYEVFIFSVSILSVVNWILFFFIRDKEALGVLYVVDLILVVIFVGDFLYRLFTAESKRNYFLEQLGWLDLLGSFPLPQFRIARLGRVVRAIILMRDLGGRGLFRRFMRDRVGSAAYLVAFMIILVLEFGSLAVLSAEDGAPGATIDTSGDAVWWSVVTIATVGYGDTYPVTSEGRLIGVFVIVLGVALFGVVTGTLANRFVQPPGEESSEEELYDEAVDLASLLKKVEAQGEAHDKAYSELETQIKEIKRLLQEEKQNT